MRRWLSLLVLAMPRGERKDPAWTNIPVPGVVTSRRDSTQEQRLRRKREEEEEELRKRRKDQEEAALILARRWQEEDRGGRSRILGAPAAQFDALPPPRNLASASSPSRRRRFEEERGIVGAASGGHVDERRRRQEEERGYASVNGGQGDLDRSRRRRRTEDVSASEARLDFSRAASSRSARRHGEKEKVLVPSEVVRPNGQTAGPAGVLRPADGQGTGSWVSEERGTPAGDVEGRRAASSHRQLSNAREAALVHGMPSELAEAHGAGSKLRTEKKGGNMDGIFGLSDSDAEQERTRHEIAAASKSRSSRLSLEASRPKPVPSLLEGRKSMSAAEVHTRLAQWKQTCNGKWVPMPEDLRQAVEGAMGISVGK